MNEEHIPDLKTPEAALSWLYMKFGNPNKPDRKTDAEIKFGQSDRNQKIKENI